MWWTLAHCYRWVHVITGESTGLLQVSLPVCSLCAMTGNQRSRTCSWWRLTSGVCCSDENELPVCGVVMKTIFPGVFQWRRGAACCRSRWTGWERAVSAPKPVAPQGARTPSTWGEHLVRHTHTHTHTQSTIERWHVTCEPLNCN